MMNTVMKKTMLAAGWMVLAGAVGQASAASLYLSSVSPSAQSTVNFVNTGAVTTPFVGTINWSFDANAPENSALGLLVQGSTLTTYCIEGTQDVTVNAMHTYANLLTNPAQAPIDNAGSNYVMGTNSATLQKFWDMYYGLSTGSDANAAAFQLGVWEIVYDGGVSANFGVGGFQASAVSGDAVSAAALIQAQSWLSGLSGGTATDHYSLYVLSDPGLQDQLFGVKASGTPREVPLPAALPAGLALLGAMGAYRKMRRK